ncbi:MAG: hypothetical protein ABIY50_13610 [Ignavibacteria bacterium]
MHNNVINISYFPKHIFWEFKDDSILDEEIVIKNVLLFGEIEDYKILIRMITSESLAKVVDDLGESGEHKKRFNFIKKIIM